MAECPTPGVGIIGRNTLERVNEAFLVPCEHLQFDSEDGGTFGYKTAVWGYPRGDVVSILYGPQQDQDDQSDAINFILECEKVLDTHKNLWIRNPCILEVYGISCINNQPCFVVEQINFPLSAVFQSAPQRESLRVVFDKRNAFYTAVDIINGLKYLHSRHIVHCALSPENVALVVGEQSQFEVDGKPFIVMKEFKRAKIVVSNRTCKEFSQWTTPGPGDNASLLHYIPKEYHNTTQCTLIAHKGVDIYSYAMILEEVGKTSSGGSHNEHLQLLTIAREIKESFSKAIQNKPQLPAQSTGIMTAEEIYSTLCPRPNTQEGSVKFGQSEEVALRRNQHVVINDSHHKLDEAKTQKAKAASKESETVEIHDEVPATSNGGSVTSTANAKTANQPGRIAGFWNWLETKFTRRPSITRSQFVSDLS